MSSGNNWIDKQKKTGIFVLSQIDYETNPEIVFDFSILNQDQAGDYCCPYVYDTLTKETLLKGYKIVEQVFVPEGTLGK
jgi:hypothetical protein